MGKNNLMDISSERQKFHTRRPGHGCKKGNIYRETESSFNMSCLKQRYEDQSL